MQRRRRLNNPAIAVPILAGSPPSYGIHYKHVRRARSVPAGVKVLSEVRPVRARLTVVQ